MKAPTRQHGFTLVEMVVVVLVIGILAGIAVPRLIDVQQDAACQATVSQVREIFQAAELHHATHGVWPDNTPVKTMPPEFEGVLPERLFKQPSPIGRAFDWNGPGTGLPTYGVSIPPPLSSETRKRIDLLHDDGDPSSGWITVWTSGALLFELAPK